ncbi:MAG TPA: peptide ABC transporter substrate-binding protein [Rectinemataceae bacterium]|nr:peptide ABC transporter substrate-binding protein [Rectinemataceae bacterium]
MRPGRYTLLSVLLALMATASVGFAQDQGGGSPDAAKPDEFVVAFNQLDVQFDPHHSIYSAEAQIFTATYEGLFAYNPSSLEPVKAACRTFNRSQDGRTYTFYIRDDARWSDGSPLVASDFRNAWLRAITPSQKADYASFFDIIAGARDFRSGATQDPSTVGITVISDKILQVKLTSRADYFTRLLCHHSFAPIHPSMLAVRDWSAHFPFPVDGAYRFESRTANELILVKNEKYWDASSVAIPRIRMLFSDDDADATRRYDGGELNWLAGPMDLDALVDRASIQANPMFGTHYWFFNCAQKPWDNPDLRRALALLLPWKDIRSKDSYLIPADTLVLPFQGYESVKGIAELNETEAASLLAKAGFTHGAGLPPIVLLTPDGDDAKRIAGIMKSSWEKLPGVSVTVQLVPAATYFEALRNGAGTSAYTLGLTTWIGDFADPIAFLQMWTSDSNLNDARLRDPEFDTMLTTAAGKEGDDRLAALGDAESHLLSGAAVLPIFHSIAVNIIDTNYIQGWYTNPLDIHPFKYLAFGTRKARPNVIIAPIPTGSVASLDTWSSP